MTDLLPPSSRPSPSPPRQALLTGVILARNEADVIADAVTSLREWTDEIIVLDDESTDATAARSRECGAEVIGVRHTEQFNSLRNEAVAHASGGWLFFLDADERVPAPLGAALRALVLVQEQGHDFDAVAVPRRNLFCGTWIRHSGWFPDYQMRLLRAGSFRYRAEAHAGVEVNGRVVFLPPDPDMAIVHDGARDVDRHMAKVNHRSALEAMTLDEAGAEGSWQAMLARFVADLQGHLDEKEGWRDGTPGLVVALSSAIGGLLAQAKLWDRQHRRGDACDGPVPESAAELLQFMARAAAVGPDAWLHQRREPGG